MEQLPSQGQELVDWKGNLTIIKPQKVFSVNKKREMAI